jgi:carbon-monoxide dehydrogenase large subunit
MFVLERLLDLAADELGLERDELRRRNLVPRARLPYRSATGLTYASGNFSNTMQRAQEVSDWAGFESRRASAASRGKRAGIGIANYVEAPVGAPHERVHVTVLPEGVVEVTVGTQSSGQGHATTFAQVVADALGCTPMQVRLIAGDTQRVSTGGGTHSDRSMRLAGTLLVEACARVLDLAREFDPDRKVDLFELASRYALSAEAAFTGRLAAHPTGAAVCEVEVDPESGLVELTRYTCVDDVGRPINPLVVEGQIHGGIVQGVGQALSESVVFDAETAQLLSASFLDYPIPRAAWFPELVSELVEDPTEGNPLRVKGGGESGITPSLAVVVDAVVDALRPLGVVDLEMPLTAARVWTAIERARRDAGRPPDPAAAAHTAPG